jgi:hypothetical protein
VFPLHSPPTPATRQSTLVHSTHHNERATSLIRIAKPHACNDKRIQKRKVSIGLHDDYMTIIISERRKKFFQSQHHHPPSSRFIDEPVFATHSLSRGGHHHYYLVTFKNRHPSNRLNVSIRHHTTTPSLTASSGLRYAFHACTYISFTASFMDPSHSCMHDCVLDYRPVEFPGFFRWSYGCRTRATVRYSVKLESVPWL